MSIRVEEFASEKKVARLRVEEAALIVIDMQDGFRPIIPDFDDATERIGKLMEAARLLHIPTIVTEQYPKGLKHTVASLGAHVAHAKAVIPKTSFSCWGADEFQSTLRETRKRQAVVCGVETHICVMQTTLDLLEQGYEVFVVADGCASRFPINKQAGLDRMREAGATICTFEMTLFEWMGGSMCPQFKAIQNLVR